MATIFRRVQRILEPNHLDLSPQTPSYAWSTGQALAPILPPTLPGAGITEADALACPPVARALGLVSSALARHRWHGPAETLAWLTRDPDPALGGTAFSTPARLRDLLTVQDLVLRNRALWVVSRDADGAIYDAAYLRPDAWAVDETGQVTIQEAPAAPGTYIYFQGAKKLPFLDSAKDSLAHYRDMAKTIASRGANPIPLVNLQLLEDYEHPEPGDEDYDENHDPALAAAKSWGAARRSPEGAVAITPRHIEAKFPMPSDDGHMLIEARNAVRLDVANHMNMNAELLDGDNGASDTYSNSLQDRGDFADLTLPLFLDPITWRLSMSDVSPSGPVTLSWPAAQAHPDATGNAGTATSSTPPTTQEAVPAAPAVTD